jgi:DNA-binding SARP family transcriptional activator/tetratricopeptide (TPR) repeat protein
VKVRVLGPMVTLVADSELQLSAPKERGTLALLALGCGSVVSSDRIYRGLWGEEPPRTANKAVQGYVSKLRQVLPLGVIETVSPGYRCALVPDDVDALFFESLVDRSRRDEAHDPVARARTLSEALRLWRGPALGDLADHEVGRNEATRLWEMRLTGEEERLDALLACGQHQMLVAELMASVDAEPFRETRCAQLMLALYRSGRRAEALRTYHRHRSRLAAEVGIEPSSHLSSLEASILDNRPELDWAPLSADSQLESRPKIRVTAANSSDTRTVPLPRLLGIRPSAGLVGREGEVDAIQDAFKRVMSDRGLEVVLVAGEAGVGKSTLIAESARIAFDAGACVLFASSQEDLATPYQLFAEALGHYVESATQAELKEMVHGHESELAHLLPRLSPGVPGITASKAADTDTERYLLFASVTDLIANVADQRPIVLVLDDLQWADSGSLQLLRHLIAVERPIRMLVLGAYRDSEASRSADLVETLGALRRRGEISRLQLSGLNQAEVVMLMEAAAGHPLEHGSLRLAQSIFLETDGNPFFVTEVLRHLLETGEISRDGTGRWIAVDSLEGSTLSAGVREVIDARVAHVGRGAKRLLAMAAVIGREFDLDLLSAVTGTAEDDLLDVLDASAAAALVREEQGGARLYGFTHALIQRSLYQGLSATRRAQAHARVAESLERLFRHDLDSRAGELALHWSSTARRGDMPKALDYAHTAADLALADLAPGDALLHYAQALSIYQETENSDPGLELDLLIGLGTAQRQTGDPSFRETLLGAAHRAADLDDTNRLTAAALANNRGILSQFGEVDLEKISILEVAADRLPRSRPDRALVMATLCQELTFSSTLERRLGLAEEAIDVAEQSCDDSTILRVLNHVANPLRVPELLEESLGRSADALLRAERVGDPVLHFWAATARRIISATAGDRAEVDRCLEIGKVLSDQLNQPTLTWTHTYATADRVLLAGDLNEAERLANEALAIGTQSGEPDAVGVFSGQLLSICSQRGTMGDLIPLIEQAVANNPGLPVYKSVLAAAHAEGGRTEVARQVLEESAKVGFELPNDIAWVTGMVTYAEAAIECRDPRFAEPLFSALRPWSDQFSYNDVTTEGPVSHYLGGLATVLGLFDEAEAYFSRSAKMCRQLGAKCFLARTELNWARMLLERGEPGDAHRTRRLLETARATSVNHGYATTARRSSHYLARLP